MKHFLKMSNAEVKFAMNSMTDTLPTPQRLLQWKVADYRSGRHLVSDVCPLCEKEKGTLGHILGSCEVALSKDGGSRFTWRHDQILEQLVTATKSKLEQENQKNWIVYDDLANSCDRVQKLMKSLDSAQRPDLIAVDDLKKKMVIMELTVPMETQIAHWNATKSAKYRKLCDKLTEDGYGVEFFAVEVGCRGLVTKSLLAFLSHIGLKKKEQQELAEEISRTAVSCSWRIFQARSSRCWSLDNNN
jgi:hypothetical protein